MLQVVIHPLRAGAAEASYRAEAEAVQRDPQVVAEADRLGYKNSEQTS